MMTSLLFGLPGSAFGPISGANAGISGPRAISDGLSGFRDILARLADQEAGRQSQSTSDGVAQYGLMGWADETRRRLVEVQALADVIAERDLTTDEVKAMDRTGQAKLAADVMTRTKDAMVQAVKDGELDKLERKKAVLYRHTPPEPEKDTMSGI